MKNLVALTLLAVSACSINAQVTYNDSRDDIMAYMHRSMVYRAHIVANHITQQQTYGYKGNKPAGVLMNEWKYDSRGNNTDWTEYKHGKVKEHSTVNYDDSNWITSYALYNRKNRLESMYKNTHDKVGNLVEQDWYGKDGQTVIMRRVNVYDSRNDVTESKVFGKKDKLKSRIEYAYYDDGSKKQTTEYAGSGKIMGVWNFDCNPVGKKQAEKLKDTDKICIHFETDRDGNPIKVKDEYIGGTGLFNGTVRSISKFDKNNNLLERAYYDLKGKLEDHWTMSYNEAGNMTTYTTYQWGGQDIMYKTTYAYDNSGNVVESDMYKKSKQVPSSQFKYVYTSSVSSPAK